MTRREFPAKVKLAAFERSGKRCEGCTAPLLAGRFHYDHDLPDWLGGEPTLANCRVLCVACHSTKTREHDVPRIAKTKRVRDRHIGAKAASRNPIPGSRASKWKRKMNGEVVPR